ncbi:hypothetical protein X975_24221, partial [Stegodyphus mimosarum]
IHSQTSRNSIDGSRRRREWATRWKLSGTWAYVENASRHGRCSLQKSSGNHHHLKLVAGAN